LGLDREDLRVLTRLGTGHCAFNLHLSRLGLSEGTMCPVCLVKPDTSFHLVCRCPGFAELRTRVFGESVLGEGDFVRLTPKCLLRFAVASKRTF
jgi:hypothetical protein